MKQNEKTVRMMKKTLMVRHPKREKATLLSRSSWSEALKEKLLNETNNSATKKGSLSSVLRKCLAQEHNTMSPQLLLTNWLLNHLAKQLIETLGRVPFCAHCTSHAGQSFCTACKDVVFSSLQFHKSPGILLRQSLHLQGSRRMLLG